MAEKVAHSKISVYDIFFANKTRKTYSNIIFGLTLVIILIVFALRPTITTISKIKEKISRYEQINPVLETKLNNFRNLSRQYGNSGSAGLKDQIEFLNKVFASTNDIQNIVNNIFKRASDTDVIITAFSPDFPVTSGLVSTSEFEASSSSPSSNYYKITISAQSVDIESARKFIGSLEGIREFPVPSRITEISITNLKNIPQESSDDNKITSIEQIDTEVNVVEISLTIIIYLDNTKIAL